MSEIIVIMIQGIHLEIPISLINHWSSEGFCVSMELMRGQRKIEGEGRR